MPNPAESRLGKGYEVHGIKRRASLFNTDRMVKSAGYQAHDHHE